MGEQDRREGGTLRVVLKVVAWVFAGMPLMKGDGVGRSLISSPRYFFGDLCSPIPQGRFWVPHTLTSLLPVVGHTQSMHTTHAQARQRPLCAASCIDAGVFQPRLGL